MNITFTGKYKSITSFEWLDIPSFVVITGPNGTGKSQLLELIYKTLVENVGSPDFYDEDNRVLKAKIDGIEIKPYDLTYLKGEWELQNTSEIDLATIQTSANDLHAQFIRGDLGISSKINLFCKELYLSGYQISKEKFLEYISKVTVDENQMSQKISEIFYNYRLSEMELLSKGKTEEYVVFELGKKPWDILREIIKESKLPFEINDPSGKGFRDAFQLKLTHFATKEEIKFNDLSSGEKVLISLVFYLYNTQEGMGFPKLFLLDEPDAHLHPTMSQQFINVIKNVLVDKYGVKVIMTTHSPSTVVLSPAESIYIMSRDEPRISKALSKNHAVSLLTSGLVYVGEGTKYILVEDNNDSDFYTYIYNQLISAKMIEPNIPLVFVPVSTKQASGGKTVVSAWVNKLQDSGLLNVMHGLIDEDNGNQISRGIYKINRYSIENYLVDPIVVFAVLIDKEMNPTIGNLQFQVGEEYKLKNLSDFELQKIADYVFQQVDSELGNVFEDFKREEETAQIEVEFTNGSKLMYPKWLLTRKGKNILNNLYNRAFNSAVNYGTAFKALKKLNIFPLELIVKFEEIKSNTV